MTVEPWEVGFGRKTQKERYDFDDEDLRPYYIQSVLEGMFELATKVFELSIKEKPLLLKEKHR